MTNINLVKQQELIDIIEKQVITLLNVNILKKNIKTLYTIEDKYTTGKIEVGEYFKCSASNAPNEKVIAIFESTNNMYLICTYARGVLDMPILIGKDKIYKIEEFN